MLVIFGKGFDRVIRPKANANTPFDPKGIPNMAKLLQASSQ